MERPERVTLAFARWRGGDESARDEVLVGLYEELRALAGRHLGAQSPARTLQPTALVHEVYLKLQGSDSSGARDREHFLAIAATAMRQVLVDYVRARNADKRGGEWRRATLERVLEVVESQDVEVESLERALEKLSGLSERQARIVELRVFGGLSVEEVAHVLGTGTTTVKSDWQFACAWLKRELRPASGEARP
jgi:RNA polymerase sigma-70 factor (ECF subfamily)